MVVRQSLADTSVGVENETVRPCGGPALKLGVSEVSTWIKAWLLSPTRTSLAVMAAAAGATIANTTPSVAMTVLAPRSVFTTPS